MKTYIVKPGPRRARKALLLVERAELGVKILGAVLALLMAFLTAITPYSPSTQKPAPLWRSAPSTQA